MLKKIAALACALTMALAFSACTPEDQTSSQLDAPQLSISGKTGTSFSVRWEPVLNANSYGVIFNDGAEKIITETSISFNDLAAGTYTVKVCAISADSKFKASEYSTISETISGQASAEDWLRMELSLPAGNEYCDINVTWTGSGIADVIFTIVEASVTEGVADDQLYDFFASGEGYDLYQFPDEYLDYLNERGQLTVSLLSDAGVVLTPETSYEVIAFATNDKGKELTLRAKQATEKKPESHPEFQKWLGEWTVTATGYTSFYFGEYEDGSTGLYYSVGDTVINFDITVQEDPAFIDQAYIYGFHENEEMPLVAMYDTTTVAYDYETGAAIGPKERLLWLISNFELGADERGNTLAWSTFAYYELNGEIDYTLIPYSWGYLPAFEMYLNEDGSAYSKPYLVGAQFSDGTVVDLVPHTLGLMWLATNGDLAGIYYETEDMPTVENPVIHIGGELTWTRNGAPAAVRTSKKYAATAAIKKVENKSMTRVK